MANLYIDLPAPAGNGVGAGVSVAAQGRVKTVTVGGTYTGNVNVQFSLDGGTTFITVASFSAAGGKQTFSLAADEMRVERTDVGAVPGLPNVDVGANDNAARIGTPAVTAGDGTGAQLDVTTFGTFNTVMVTGTFSGVVNVEFSEDGTDWAQIMSFNAPGFKSREFVARFIRINRNGVNVNTPGLPVVTIGAIDDPVTATSGTASSLLNNVKDFGALGDGATDDRVSIQAAVADAVANGIGGIIFPGGVFAVSRNGATTSSIELSGVSDFMVMGLGNKSQVLLIGDGSSADWFMFNVTDGSSRVHFQDLLLDGNQAVVTNEGVETNGINVTAVTGDTSEVNIHDCTFRNFFGDGIHLEGDGVGDIDILFVDNCLFLDNGRNGISVEHSCKFVHIRGCYFEGSTVEDIHFAPTGVGLIEQFVVTDNMLLHSSTSRAMVLDGTSNTQPHSNSVIADNIIIDGTLSSLNNSRIRVSGNVIGGVIPDAKELMAFSRFFTDVQIAENLLYRLDASTAGPILTVTDAGGFFPARLSITSNVLVQETEAGLMVLTGATEYSIDENMMQYSGIDAVQVGIAIACAAANILDIAVRNNSCYGDAGVGTLNDFVRFTAATNDIGSHMVVGNMVRGCARGVRWETSGGGVYLSKPMVCDNFFDVSSADISNITLLEAVICGGNAGLGARMQLVGDGTPEAAVTAPIGSIFQRRDGGAGTSFFVKETGAGNTGWVGK